MTTNNHTPHKSGVPLSSVELNEPLSELDSSISGTTVLTTKGDVYTYSTASARLAVGANAYDLEADSAQSEGIKWAPGNGHFAIIRDEKATTTAGGSASVATWNQRDLNTELSDVYSLVSIGSNLFTPIAGTYLIEASAPAFDVNQNRLKLYNASTLTDVFFGQGISSQATNDITQAASLTGTFTANGSHAYSIRHYTALAKATTGLGQAVSDGAVEVYCVVKLTLISV